MPHCERRWVRIIFWLHTASFCWHGDIHTCFSAVQQRTPFAEGSLFVRGGWSPGGQISLLLGCAVSCCSSSGPGSAHVVIGPRGETDVRKHGTRLHSKNTLYVLCTLNVFFSYFIYFYKIISPLCINYGGKQRPNNKQIWEVNWSPLELFLVQGHLSPTRWRLAVRLENWTKTTNNCRLPCSSLILKQKVSA